jgi:sporulation protein YlmC with PRC-barrel domain
MTYPGPTDPRRTDGTVVLVKASHLNGLPVVSITEGDALAKVKDVVYSPDEGRLLGFTLNNKRGGIFAGPLKAVLNMRSVVAIGRAAVMVHDRRVLDSRLEHSRGSRHQILRNHVLTETGERLGEVSDLIVAVGIAGPPAAGRAAVDNRPLGGEVGDVVGYEIMAAPGLRGRATAEDAGSEHTRLFIPLPNTLSVSGQNLVVPAAVENYIRDDLSGFGGAVNEFRAQLDAPQQGAARHRWPSPPPQAGWPGPPGPPQPAPSDPRDPRP